MYLTAHRVTNPSNGESAINSFFHLHGRDLGIDQSWGSAEAGRYSNGNPGALVSESTPLSPGGNRVLSYLDIVAEDSTAPELIAEMLRKNRPRISASELPFFLNENGVLMVFSLNVGLRGHEDAEYSSLGKAAMNLLGKVSHTA